MVNRCWGDDDAQMQVYHDEEWGVPEHDDQKLFEFLILEGFQAGLSWKTILHKRHNFARAFDNYDLSIIAEYSEEKLEELRQDKGIIRNRLKIAAVQKNAIAFQEVQKEWGSFNNYIWHYVDNSPILNNLNSFKEMPAKTELSIAISKDMKKKGFKFVGPTIIYAFMQAIGMINDHLVSCFRYEEINKKTNKKNNVKNK